MQAQPRLFADSTGLLIGDQLNVYLEVQTGRGEIVNDIEQFPDTLEAIRVLEVFPPESSPGYISYQWRIGVYDTGMVVIPQLPVVFDDGGRKDTLWSNDLPLFVSGVRDSIPELAPIKDIVKEPTTFEDYLPWIAALLGLCAAALIMYFYMRKTKPEQVGADPSAPILLPHEIALDKLDALAKKKLWQEGKIDAYHSELNYIVREYVENRFRIPALESTTSEILGMLPNLSLGDEWENELEKMLHAVDLIKFAKAEPPVEIHAQYMELARKLILQTKTVGSRETEKGEGDV